MLYLKHLVICALLSGYDAPPDKGLAEDPSLRRCVQQLKTSTPADDLRKITALVESELIVLHHGFGTGIRNKWLRGNRDPELIRFFREKKINEPDEMSMVLIQALWRDLNSSLSPEQRASAEKKRAIVARKREAYEKLEAACAAQLTKAKGEFERCYASHGLPSKNPISRDPFFELIVEKSGRVRKIIFFEGASPKLKHGDERAVAALVGVLRADPEVRVIYRVGPPSGDGGLPRGDLQHCPGREDAKSAKRTRRDSAHPLQQRQDNGRTWS